MENKKVRVAINGFGRIGRGFLRAALNEPSIDIVAINDLGDMSNLAYLLKYDSVYRNFDHEVAVQNGFLTVGDRYRIKLFSEKDPLQLPWKDLAIDVAVESTGFFEGFQKAEVHKKAGAKKVVISAPAKDTTCEIGRTILMGVNEDALKEVDITSNGSCTTNSVSPVVAVLSQDPGILKASLTTIHSYTATQKVVDSPDAKDWRRGRAAAQNIVPSTTGAAIAVACVFPEIIGKFDGVAIRIPTVTVSMSDITFLAKRKTTAEEINNILIAASQDKRWKGILGVTSDQVVSSDMIGNPHPAIIDLSMTKVIDGDLVKVFSWYDNEWGYSVTLVRHVMQTAKQIA
jgi:glyceraldehyde 3-phosphate dehydrogenase